MSSRPTTSRGSCSICGATGGGYLPEATALTGLFQSIHGPVVQLKDTSGASRCSMILNPRQPMPAPWLSSWTVSAHRHPRSSRAPSRTTIAGSSWASEPSAKAPCRISCPWNRWSQKPVSGQLTVTIGKFLPGHWRKHSAPRRRARRSPAPHRSDMKEVGESALEAALPWDRIAGVPFQASAAAVPALPVATLMFRRRRTRTEGPRLPLAVVGHCSHRHGARTSTASP